MRCRGRGRTTARRGRRYSCWRRSGRGSTTARRGRRYSCWRRGRGRKTAGRGRSYSCWHRGRGRTTITAAGAAAAARPPNEGAASAANAGAAAAELHESARPPDEGAATAAGAAAAAAGRPPDEGAATAAGAAAAAVARPQLLLAAAVWRRSGRTTAERGLSYSRTTAGRLARLWASSTFPKFSPSRGQPWLTSTPQVCRVTSETAAHRPSRGTVQAGGERDGGATLGSF